MTETSNKPVLNDIQQAFEAMRRMHRQGPHWFAGPPGIAAERLVRLILARYDIADEIAELLTRDRLLQTAQIALRYPG